MQGLERSDRKEDFGEHQTIDHGRRFCRRDRDNCHPDFHRANTSATRCGATAERTWSSSLRAIEPGEDT
jgi:endonuclease III